jgi:hypothetical protein
LITVYIPDNFIPERTYVINTLLHYYAGYAIRIVPRAGQMHYQLAWDDKSIVFKDFFFGRTIIGESYISPERIPDRITTASAQGLEDILMLYGEDTFVSNYPKLTVGVDVFAGAFFMLTRWEESFGLHEDQHGRFPAEKALLVRSGFILRPVVDEYVALIKKCITTFGYPEPVDNAAFKVVPTCDVDNPYYWNSRPGWRLLAGRFSKHKSLKTLKEDLHVMRKMRKGVERDPYDTFNYLMELAESRNKRFIFHMLAGGETSFEGFYTIDDPRIQQLMRSFQNRGHEMGLHPSYNAFNDPRKIDRERIALERSAGITVKATRQHYLRFAVPDTWKHLHNAYLKEDSTLGYAAEPGFRCGTSRPFPVFDIHQQKQLPLTEHPLLIMDVSLKFYKNFSVEESIQYCQQIIDQVKKHKGKLVILWHNSSLSELDGWEEWNKVLEYLMDQ